jgi:hypothetical protein
MMASESTVNTAGPTRQQQTISDIAPQVADSQTELQMQLLLLLEYEQDHVACTEAMMRFFFPSVVDVCKLQFSSKVYTDMIKALECNDPPSSSLTYVFRGTYPGADGKTIGTQTDRILRFPIVKYRKEPPFQQFNADILARHKHRRSEYALHIRGRICDSCQYQHQAFSR